MTHRTKKGLVSAVAAFALMTGVAAPAAAEAPADVTAVNVSDGSSAEGGVASIFAFGSSVLSLAVWAVSLATSFNLAIEKEAIRAPMLQFKLF